MVSPDPPTNVIVHTPTGERIPVDTVYAGQDDDGVFVWNVVSPQALPTEIARVTVDVLPAHTAIRFEVGGDPIGFDDGGR